MCDNMAVSTAFEIGSKEPILNKVITDINMLAVDHNIHITIKWVDTKSQLADLPSRILDDNEEILQLATLKMLIKKFGLKPNLDGMATFNNRKCVRYISRVPETRACHTDFLSYTPQNGDILYIFPPKNTVNFVVPHLLRYYKRTSFILIYHVFGETPPFTPFIPKSAVRIRLQDFSNMPILTPGKKFVKGIGYYKKPKNNNTYAIIQNLE